MNFDIFLKRLKNGETAEQIVADTKITVECVENKVYIDDDFFEFMSSIGVEIKKYTANHLIIKTNYGKEYRIPYENINNRFGDDLPPETIVLFWIDKIYEITEGRIIYNKRYKRGVGHMKVNELTNLFIGYNKTEDFRVLICASDKIEAKEIADEYCLDSHMEGKFDIKDFDDTETKFDCDYVLA